MKAVDIFKQIEENKNNREFLPTGFTQVDQDLDGGLLKKEIIILGAFTGIGKSILAGQIFFNIVSSGFKSAYYSLEISNEVVLSRILGQLSNIKPARIQYGLLKVDDYEAKMQAKAKITANNENMDFYDNFYIFDEIAESIKANKYEFVVIDFIQNILLTNNMDEYTRLTFISIQLQKLAKETNCCILILSQLSNKVGKEGSKVVEYKGSGGIAQVADLGLFLERGDPILDINGQPLGDQQVKLLLRKNRRGISGLAWQMKFKHPGGNFLI